MQAKALYPGITLLFAIAFTGVSHSQVPLNLPTDQAGIVALQARQEKEGKEFYKKPHVSKELGSDLDAMPELIRQEPAFSATKNGMFNYAYTFHDYIKKDHPDPKAVMQKLQAVEDALKQSIPNYYRGMFDFELAQLTVKDDLNFAPAETLAQSGVSLYNQSDCLEDDRFSAESHHIYDEKTAKHPVPFTYHIEDGDAHCAAESATRYALLGKIQAKLGNTDAAEANFQKALDVHPDMTAALGMAKIDEVKGDKTAALEMLTVAYLTGALPGEDIARTKALYVELHPGSAPADFDEMVSKRYAKVFVNPVKDSGALPLPTHPQHVVLDELFTGADCEPCMAPDLATEAALHRYTRDQVVIVVYHNNAPGPDPLTNDTSEARAKYYGTGMSTPHVFIDGKELEIEEGPPSHAQSSFNLLTKAVDPLLAEHTDVKLDVKAVRHSDGVVDVVVSGPARALPAKTHLQILLVETEVGYSGRNTLHIQPMVVRASAGLKDQETGLAIMPSGAISQDYTFDLKKVEAENFAYYDESRLDMEKRLARLITSGSWSKAEVDKMAEFREPKNLMNPNRLAVVAFLQTDDNKKVLQAAYAPVIDAQKGEKK